MKNFILFGLLIFANVAFAQEKINWMRLEEAIAEQAKEPKKILMDVYTTWCGPCKMLDKNTFQNADVAAYVNDHFYAVKFNAEGSETIVYKGKTYGNPSYNPNKTGRNTQHQLASYLQVNAYPTMIFMDENAELISPLVGYHTPRQLEIYLKLFATDKFKEIDTKDKWLDYQKAFKGEFIEE
ncbi:thioredoxin fold domain-containing protein [Flavobacteriaceae bacterium F08102]|nr:thioredoxin fold domain-containing protein [Flavobacteriaceae bacterium F08102]